MEVNELATLLATHSKENRDDINAIFNKLESISTAVNEIKVQTHGINLRVTTLEDSKKEKKGDRKYILTTVISFSALIITIVVNFIIK